MPPTNHPTQPMHAISGLSGRAVESAFSPGCQAHVPLSAGKNLWSGCPSHGAPRMVQHADDRDAIRVRFVNRMYGVDVGQLRMPRTNSSLARPISG